MSSRGRSTWVVVIGLLAHSTAATAQDVEITEESLLAHIDSMAPRMREALAATQAAHAAREKALRQVNVATTDTFSVGLLTIVAPIDQVEIAHTLYSAVWHEYERIVDRSPTLDEAYFTFQWSSTRRGIPVEDRPVFRVEGRGFVTRSGMEAQIRLAIGRALLGDIGPAPASSGKLRVTAPVTASAFRSSLYRHLAALPAVGAHDCLSGDSRACWDMMGYGSDWRDWSTQVERRALMELGYIYVRGETGRASLRACVWERQLDECDAAFEREEQRGRVYAPLQRFHEANISLLWLALEEGGEGSWGRLIDNHHLSAAEALSAASGLSHDELTERWRDFIIVNRPRSHADIAGSGLLAGLWILIFAGLAMRSTRCRFG